jgi:hypothetical protein
MKEKYLFGSLMKIGAGERAKVAKDSYKNIF